MADLTIQHNFIEEHTITREQPCNLAKQNMKLGDNRWLGLIRMSC